MSVDNICPEDWCIRYNHYDPGDEGRREVIFALGNGYLISRAALHGSTDDGIHYPGTYMAGCYNRLSTLIEGRAVENESLVNLPDWLSLTFRINGGSWFSTDETEILEYVVELNMKQALLRRKIWFKDTEGRETVYRERRFVSMDQPHLMALETELTAKNWSGELEVKSALDGRVTNNNVKRYVPFKKRHLEILTAGRSGTDSIEIKVRTIQSGIEVALAARTKLWIKGRVTSVSRRVETGKDLVEDWLKVSVNAGDQVITEKVTSLFSSRSHTVSDCGEEAGIALARAQDFNTLFAAHCSSWNAIWRRCSLEMNDKEQLRYFRLHMFQIIQNISPHTAEQDVGVPPSGWQGEEYHGHIFWDELFIFPFLTFRFPDIARSLLLYRYRRLEEARHLAKMQGYRGAMFPWRSAATGKEETPLLQYNLLSGQWMQDNTFLQRHIGAVIAYSVFHYVQVTGDYTFLSEYGAELLFEIARFWADIARYNTESGRYEIHGVAGPDEFHTRYPGSETAGINNNTFTNVMAAWTLRKAREIWEELPPYRQQDMEETLSLSKEEAGHWDVVSKKIKIDFLEEGVLNQFEGFSNLEITDPDKMLKKYDHQRIDWALEAEGDFVERYQISKQADTSLLLYLFTPEELSELLNRMGYGVSREQLKRTVDYHIAHTVHQSSLSKVVHAGALARLDPETSWKYFQEAQLIDMKPSEDKDTSEGIHLGAMGGTLFVLQHHYLGIRVLSGILEIDPEFPAELKWVEMAFYFRGLKIWFKIRKNIINLNSELQKAGQVKVRYKNELKILNPGENISFNIIR